MHRTAIGACSVMTKAGDSPITSLELAWRWQRLFSSGLRRRPFPCFCAACLLVAFGDLSPINTTPRCRGTGVNSEAVILLTIFLTARKQHALESAVAT